MINLNHHHSGSSSDSSQVSGGCLGNSWKARPLTLLETHQSNFNSLWRELPGKSGVLAGVLAGHRSGGINDSDEGLLMDAIRRVWNLGTTQGDTLLNTYITQIQSHSDANGCGRGHTQRILNYLLRLMSAAELAGRRKNNLCTVQPSPEGLRVAPTSNIHGLRQDFPLNSPRPRTQPQPGTVVVRGHDNNVQDNVGHRVIDIQGNNNTVILNPPVIISRNQGNLPPSNDTSQAQLLPRREGLPLLDNPQVPQ